MLFKDEFVAEVQAKYGNQPRSAWPPGAAYVLDPQAQREREILESIFSDYPEISHKKRLQDDLLSFDKDQFWSAWAELMTFDYFSERHFEVEPEPRLGTRPPDFLITWPSGKESVSKAVVEVTTVNAESKRSLNLVEDEDELLKKRIYDRIQEKITQGKVVEDLKMPLLLVIIIKGPYFADTLEQAYSEVLRLSEAAMIEGPKRLSGILIFYTMGLNETDGSYRIVLEPFRYPNPGCLYPFDPYFDVLTDPISGIDEEGILVRKIRTGEITL